MEKTKVKISEHITDLIKIGYATMTLEDASCILERIAVNTKDSLLKDSTEHLINEINKYQDKINGYVDGNYEIVGEEK